MSWSMPTSGQWPSGVTPENMNMGNYTAEQWTAMQQQHWQQWAQWQQQYATWQSQYGTKYAEQMQAIQSMGAMPPLPPTNAAPPPAPPPPDKPPPPPHENNQPLYAHTQQQPKPVMAPGLNNDSSNNITDTQTGNNQNRSYATDVRSDVAQSLVNSEALKSLAEEEKAFDIQFQKWEEEIENWKKANINHPDRKAYEEYEQRFESCRARLLERRQQMKEKRAKLLGNVQASINPPNSAPKHYTNINVPPPGHNVTPSNISVNKEYPGSSFPPQNFNKSMMPIQQISNMSQKDYNREYNANFDPQDRYDSYMTTSNNANVRNNSNLVSTEPFLQTSEPSKGIPGLDLVPETEKYTNRSAEVIDITDEPIKKPLISAQPDYSTISKGINNILGDEKIMNILSMVRGQGQEPDQGPSGTDAGNSNKYWDRNEGPNNNFGQGQNNNYGPGQNNNFGPGQNNNFGPGQNNNFGPGQNNNYRPGQNNSYGQGQNKNFGPGQNNNFGPGQNNNFGPGQSSYGHGQNNYGPGQNNNYGPGQNMPYNMQQNDHPMHQDNNPPPNFASAPARGYVNKPDDAEPNQYYDRNQQHNGQNMPPRPMPPRPNGPRPMQPNIRPNMPMRSLLDPIPQENEYSAGGFDRRDMLEGLPNQGPRQNVPPRPPPAARPSWAEEPLFTPSIIVEYEHKPLRLKARDFIEPVHTFDYNHQSKDGDKRKDFEKEADNLFVRNRRLSERDDVYADRHKESFYRDHEKLFVRDHIRDARDDHYLKGPTREDYNDRRRHDDNGRDRRYDDRRRDDRDKYSRREDFHRDREREDFRDRDRDQERFRDRDAERFRDRERERDLERLREKDRYPERGRERDRDSFKDNHRDHRRSRSHDKDNRKRGHSKESDRSNLSNSKKSKDGSSNPFEKPKHMIMIDDILEPPGRHIRPEKIVIILRGPPGSGKSYLAKLIREREAEHGGTVRVMSIDDYFMQEGEIEETDPATGKIVKKPSLKYEYDEKQEENYIFSLNRAFKRSLTDGYFTFLIYDAVNDQLRSYADIWNFARQNNFQVYVCTMDLDPKVCYKRNIHNRTLEDIEVITARFFPTPDHHIQLDPTTLLQNASIQEVQMEDVEDDVTMEDAQETEVDKSFTSKWEKMDDAAQLARLDGTSKPLRPSQLSMEDYLQLDDWKPNTSKPGKKTVRWADIEERRQQEKMRAIGFVVGQTDWNRMTDPTMGSSALTQTKYIERVRRF